MDKPWYLYELKSLRQPAGLQLEQGNSPIRRLAALEVSVVDRYRWVLVRVRALTTDLAKKRSAASWS